MWGIWHCFSSIFNALSPLAATSLASVITTRPSAQHEVIGSRIRWIPTIITIKRTPDILIGLICERRSESIASRYVCQEEIPTKSRELLRKHLCCWMTWDRPGFCITQRDNKSSRLELIVYISSRLILSKSTWKLAFDMVSHGCRYKNVSSSSDFTRHSLMQTGAGQIAFL